MQPTIKSFEAACEALGIPPVLPDLSHYPEIQSPHIKATQAHYQLAVIAQALNREANGGKDWQPDWEKYSQPKWYPWFSYSAGSGFAFHVCDNGHGFSGVGSRLCFLSKELAKYAATQFPALYNQLFTL